MSENKSLLEKERLFFKPSIPKSLMNISSIIIEKKEKTEAQSDIDELKKLFPKTFGQHLVKLKKEKELSSNPIRVGVVFSGGQASGGHNVIAGLFDALMELNPKSKLFGFLNGPSGIVDNKSKEITKELLSGYRNLGGFDLIGSGRTKIETKEQLEKSLKTANDLNLDGIVIIGGDDSNTNAAILAEYFVQKSCTTKVIGVPKTIDGDLKTKDIEISFGFDTACKVYSELIGNIARDALSAKKYYHFIKLMGRSASHIALECALSTHPNSVIIAEEVKKNKNTLSQITEKLADTVCKRSADNKNFGVFLIPEGLIEFIPEMTDLISELNKILAEGSEHSKKIESLKDDEKINSVVTLLSESAKKTFSHIPNRIQMQLLLDRDPHGNVQVSRIETERLLIDTVSKELEKRKKENKYSGKFNALQHFFGYEGRACIPSNFDAQYCYALGRLSAVLINNGLTGYICCVNELNRPVENWEAKGLPITMLMNLEERHGKKKAVIKKALVDLNGKAFSYLKKNQEKWEISDNYRYPGPIQYFGSKEITDALPLSLDT